MVFSIKITKQRFKPAAYSSCSKVVFADSPQDRINLAKHALANYYGGEPDKWKVTCIDLDESNSEHIGGLVYIEGSYSEIEKEGPNVTTIGYLTELHNPSNPADEYEDD